MAANKFATMLHRNTNKITLILVYALLEWILIILLLLNSLFSYVIIKFADYFGLKRPCLFCSRLDHIFEPTKHKNCYRDLVCEDHATEISKLGFCLNHQKLAESQDMCEDCSSSSQLEFSKKFAFFPWMRQIGVIQGENGEMEVKCSCCGERLDRKFYSPYLVIKPSWDVLDYTQKGNLIEESGFDDKDAESEHSHEKRLNFVSDHRENEDGIEENRGIQVVSNVSGGEGGSAEEAEDEFSCFISSFDCKEMVEKESEKIDLVVEKEKESIKENLACDETKNEVIESKKEVPLAQHLEFYIDQEDCHLIPVEFMEPTKPDSQNAERYEKEHQVNCDGEDFVLDFGDHVVKQVELSVESEGISQDEPKIPVLGPMELKENESSLVFEFEERRGDDVLENAFTPSEDTDLDVHQVLEEVFQVQNDELEPEVSIGTEIPDQEHIDDIQPEVLSSYQCAEDEHCTSSSQCIALSHHDYSQIEQELVEFKTRTVDTKQIEEEKVPDTPTSVDSLSGLTSEIELGDGILTVEKLKTVLRTERRALNALYMELEEERSASAVAANQTMAMINRLQEEKAAMQMEALQYQRMMEEQSEYDQEALQLLNELMVKREKEKAELEKELEVNRKKVQEYEAKEKLMIFKRMKESRTSSAYSEDSDGLSVDSNHDERENQNNNTPADAVLYLEESLANFEEERLSILEQLKLLEHKLFTLDGEEDQHFEDIKPVEHFHGENGNGHYEKNGHAHYEEKRFKGPKAKRLLPLFNAETEDGILNGNGNENGFDSDSSLKNSSVENCDEQEKKKVAIEEEVDHVYERLQALEADREFLKHCISSLRKGDKGVHLLQEILQHLRDLRSVELRVKNIEDIALY